MAEDCSWTILVDNEAHAPGLACEHGLSVWIEAGAARILFDTGRGKALLPNARTLGIDLSSATHVVLSHGHYDHTGALADLAGILPPGTPIHAHPGIFAERFSRHEDGTLHEIGLPEAARRVLEARGADLRLSADSAEVAPGVHATGFVPRVTEGEDAGGDFWFDRACTRPDPVEDDMALWVDCPGGMRVFLGCAHAGTINTIQHIRSTSGREEILSLVGGTHLRKVPEERLRQTARFLAGLSAETILPCHCSGERIRTMLDAPRPGLHCASGFPMIGTAVARRAGRRSAE